jgi:hypothetical protein
MMPAFYVDTEGQGVLRTFLTHHLPLGGDGEVQTTSCDETGC